jgi:hypothetical protein
MYHRLAIDHEVQDFSFTNSSKERYLNAETDIEHVGKNIPAINKHHGRSLYNVSRNPN